MYLSCGHKQSRLSTLNNGFRTWHIDDSTEVLQPRILDMSSWTPEQVIVFEPILLCGIDEVYIELLQCMYVYLF